MHTPVNATPRRRLEPFGPDRIAVRHGASVEIVSVCDLLFVRVNGNTCCIATVNGDIPVHAPLRDVIGALGEMRVLQIHRSVAVSSTRIRRIIGSGRHRLCVVLDTGHALTVGREFQAIVRRRLVAPPAMDHS